MSNRIEPGCLALVVHGADTGLVVTCVEYQGPGFMYRAAGTGKLMKATGPAWITDDPDGGQSIRDQSALLRIDGGAESAESHAERCRKGVPT